MATDTNGTLAPEFKRCNSCAQDKPATAEFFATRSNTRYKDGLQSQCRACIAAKQRERNLERGHTYRETARAKAVKPKRKPGRPVTQTLQERFEAKVFPEPMSGCWLWDGPMCKETGYGLLWTGSRSEGAHRLAWGFYRGTIPDDLWVFHRCGNRACVNPKHLFLGTLLDRRDRLPKAKVLASFEASYLPEPNSGCWLWLGPYDQAGYGNFSAGRREDEVRAHRFSWRIHNCEIPNEMHICHSCDTPECVNPQHLFLGTAQDNVTDCVQKGRRKHKPGREYPNARRGELCPTAKVTSEDVRLIRSLPITGVEAAKRFGISTAVVSKIRLRQAWASVE